MRKLSFIKTATVLGLFGAATLLAAPAALAAEHKENCRLIPKDRSQPSTANEASPTDKLGDCNSVLHPPGVGDKDMVQPAPDVGKMPVIPPKAVPPAKNDGNGAQTN